MNIEVTDDGKWEGKSRIQPVFLKIIKSETKEINKY
jgi:hypothetical protein